MSSMQVTLRSRTKISLMEYVRTFQVETSEAREEEEVDPPEDVEVINQGQEWITPRKSHRVRVLL